MSSPTAMLTGAASSPRRSTASASTRESSGGRRRSPTSTSTSISGSRPSSRETPVGKNHPNVDKYVVSRVRALESILLEKGILPPDAVDRVIQRYEADTGPMVGVRAVARAWVDPAYKQRLLEDPRGALKDFGLDYEALRVVENTPAVHNVVVCTLCSCYPWAVLGLPPTWYKMPAYRSRTVAEPRKVLAEFGLTIPESREIRVWDSSAELRYMVLPERPAGSQAMGEAALIPLITRDALIGVADVRLPSPACPRSRWATSATASSSFAPTAASSTSRGRAGSSSCAPAGAAAGARRMASRPSPPRCSTVNGSGGASGTWSTSRSAVAWGRARWPTSRSCSSTARRSGSTR